MIVQNLESVVKVVTYSLILIFKFRDKNINSKKMQIFFSSCHFLRRIRQFVLSVDIEINEIPTELFKNILEKHGLISAHLDLGNTIIFESDFFSEGNFKQSNWLLVQTSSGTARWVHAVSLSIKKMKQKCFCTHQLYHNLFFRVNSKPSIIQVFPETLQQSSIDWATNARISLLNSAKASDDSSVEKLKRFFNFKKYVQVGDLIEVDSSFMFIVHSVDSKSVKKNIGYFVENQKSSLFQLASVPSLKIPIKQKCKRNSNRLELTNFEEIKSCILPNRPPCLSEYCEYLQKILVPFVINGTADLISWNSSVSLPTFLMIGSSGSGKRFALKCVADFLGLHFVEESCLSLLGESSKASELRIRSVFQNIREVSPAVLYLTDIDVSPVQYTHNNLQTK